jgi:trimethylamine--corrinoid protein Co-methyltransferase
LPALAGANLIYGLGMIEMGMTIDFGQLVMDNEFAGMIKFVLQGIPVNTEMLAVKAIQEIGIGNNFLSHASTINHMKSQSQPQLIDRRMRDRWASMGSMDIHGRAIEEARHILETHKPDPLPDDVLATLRGIVEEAEEELGVTAPAAKK